ncbi:MAG: leucine--tRNA ligase, partial [Phycisphaerae bacterium]
VNGEKIPIWVADYVLITYGTGAIMAVPAHDTRDFEFARQFNLPIREVVRPASAAGPGPLSEAYTGDGTAVHSGEFDGLTTAAFMKRITTWLEERDLGYGTINYKLRDWLFSRQRYWGEPFPILHGPEGELVALDESELPLELPEIDDYRPISAEQDKAALPDPPLGRACQWTVIDRDGKKYRRELNTMPQWAGSCWYYLRFLDPCHNERLCGEQAERYWMVSNRKDGTSHAGGIDLYLGGAEHAVLHLLYARFWHKVLYDLGHVSTPEPFGKLFNQGMIRAFAYKDDRGRYVAYEDIDFREDGAYGRRDGARLDGAVEKMSKSMKNVINPEVVVREYGADSLRLYEMFMGPLDAGKPWNPRDVPGVFRFLQRTWRLIAGGDENGPPSRISHGELDPGLEKSLHKTIRKVTDDIERLAFNTAISAMMEFVNEAYRAKGIHASQAERFTRLLSPFAPHLCEELWQRLRGAAWNGSLAYEPWPNYDERLLVEEEIEIPVQVNGKLVGRVTVAKDADEAAIRAAATANERVAARIGNAEIAKTIYVPGRMLNVIVKQ